MAHFCLFDLAHITGGDLRLAAMPPVGGDLTPVRRIVIDPAATRPGDVLWCLADRPCDAELAFLRGALGVVASGRHIEPWPGCFSLQVVDPVAALERLVAQFIRHQMAAAHAETDEISEAAKEFVANSPELKVLQLCDSSRGDIYPLTCGQSAKGHAARRCRGRAA